MTSQWHFWLFRHLNGVEMLYGKFGNYKAAGEGYVNFSGEIISAENAHKDLCAVKTGNTKEHSSSVGDFYRSFRTGLP